MLKSILDLLRRPAPTSADLSRALTELPASGTADALAAHEARRRAMLLDGSSDGAIEKVEREIAAAARERDRLIAAREELTARLVQAEEAERLEALAAEIDAAEKEAQAIATLFRTKYAPHVAELFAMLKRLDAAEATIVELNRRLVAGGFLADRVGPVEPRFAADPPLTGLRRFAYFVKAEAGPAHVAGARA